MVRQVCLEMADVFVFIIQIRDEIRVRSNTTVCIPLKTRLETRNEIQLQANLKMSLDIRSEARLETWETRGQIRESMRDQRPD